ncbi:MAG: type II restriction endonuclease [Muribaculaceae bacterium]|nr:type II restriction endonuclease [Muribaculaceae bacterium]
MAAGYINQAIQSVLNSEKAFCKFLSANDTGATGAHQSGILISKSAVEMMFGRQELMISGIPKKTVKIRWQDDFITESSFTYYESKRELRITRFGRGFPFLRPEQTGSLFVFIRQTNTDYSGYFLDTDKDIEEFLDTFGISPTETNSLIDVGKVSSEMQEKMAVQEFIESFGTDFPTSDVMSAAARVIEEKVYDRIEDVTINPDRKLISWTNMEYTLFRALEYARYGEIIKKGFSSVDEFVRIANMVLNRRKSRAGKSLEHHLAAIFDRNEIEYSAQAVTEGNKRPDFLFSLAGSLS